MGNLQKQVKRKAKLTAKHFYQDLLTKNTLNKRIVFILGCQRSGTTMLTKVFEGDLNIRVYNEFSELSSTNTPRLRLNPYPMVKTQIARRHAGIVVLKPLVESQNIDKLFDFFPNSLALWPVRHFRDVVASNLKKFGPNNGINDLRPIANGEENNWRAERISTKTKMLVNKYFNEDMNPNDAAALFWYVRNIIFFERGLNQSRRTLLIKYQDLVSDPDEKMQEVYGFIGTPYPQKELVRSVHSKSVGKGNSIELSNEIEFLCDELWQRFDSIL